MAKYYDWAHMGPLHVGHIKHGPTFRHVEKGRTGSVHRGASPRILDSLFELRIG